MAKRSSPQNPGISTYKGPIKNTGSPTCRDRGTASHQAKRIQYVPPFDYNPKKTETFVRMKAKNKPFELRSGSTYQSHNGKRLVLEVGCSTILFVKIAGKNFDGYHIQSHEGFLYDIQWRALAKATTTRINRDAKIWYERWKLGIWYAINVYSGTSWVAFFRTLSFTGPIAIDKFITSYSAVAELNNTVIREMNDIKNHSPVLHKKLDELISSELSQFPNRSFKAIPDAVKESDVAMVAYAGAITAKFWNLIKKRQFTKTSISLFLTQLAVATALPFVTYSPLGISKAIDQRYQPMIDSLSAKNLKTAKGGQTAKQTILEFFKTAGITISKQEEEAIMKEIAANPTKLSQNLLNFDKALKNFKANNSYKLLP